MWALEALPGPAHAWHEAVVALVDELIAMGSPASAEWPNVAAAGRQLAVGR